MASRLSRLVPVGLGALCVRMPTVVVAVFLTVDWSSGFLSVYAYSLCSCLLDGPKFCVALRQIAHLFAHSQITKQHGRRGSPKLRLIFCNEDCSRVYWASDRHNSSKRSNLSSLAIADVTEVREGTAPDPHHPGLFGTATLRRRRASSLAVPVSLSSDDSSSNSSRQLPPAPRAFSLIATARSLDLEALSADEFSLLLEGFRAAVGLSMTATAAAPAAAPAPAPTGPGKGAVEGKSKKAAAAFGV